jgi:hypothetical protein
MGTAHAFVSKPRGFHISLHTVPRKQPALGEGDPDDVMLNFRRDAEISAQLHNLSISDSTGYEWHWCCGRDRGGTLDRANMTLKIERYSDGAGTTIRLIGRMRAEHLMELEKQIKESESKIVLDLEELKLVDVDTVRFLGSCEAAGVTLLNCAPYIRDWIGKERD